jgi:tetratricopeptide (TPR) repeat protein
MSFWRKDVIQPALDSETRQHMEEQLSWIRTEPANAQPYCNLARLYRMDGRQEEALGLLLEAVRLDDGLAEAHIELVEIYAIRADYKAAWRHARAAERANDSRGVQLLERYGVAE